ncbi:hypothetical protein RJ639_014479 [Escallonia herrerae]|uniref:Germin-like protein n=1 Tax=Escallonia herrerae TaxID=1293975 RepID=A0AA89AMI9_9ASTE|nr:hypothetical protein RJ639_014479 [Escallonia herrerae]
MARASPWRSSNLLRVASTRPHATGLLFVVEGSLEVGFVDNTNKLYTQTLQAGDVFIFPKSLIHYQFNADASKAAMAIAAFGTANGGSVSIPATMFEDGTDDDGDFGKGS